MAKIDYIKGLIEVRKMRAHYWLAMATSGFATKRVLTHGTGKPFTDEEKIEDALNTAHRHIELMNELVDDLAEEE